MFVWGWKLVTARNKRCGKHEWKSTPRLGAAAARRRARKWVAVTAMAPVLLLPTTLAASSSFLTDPSQPVSEEPDPGELGVSGNLPQVPLLSLEVLARAADPQQLATGAGPQVELPTGSLGIPGEVLDAYVRAANQVDRGGQGCGLHWSVLASIGRIESGHARSGNVDVLGTTVRAILGPRLSGDPGIAAIPDTDAGRYDGDPVWDRAVGPMQFIPSTWQKFAVDGNDDGVASPHNIHDASLAAARYLCSGGDLRSPQNLAAAVFRYNHSDSYVRTVLIWAAAYAKGVTPTPSELAPEVGDVLEGERLPDGPQVLAMVPPAPPTPTGAPAPQPTPATPAPTGPPPDATPRPAEQSPTIGVPPLEIPEPSPPDLTPPGTTTPPGTPPSAIPPGASPGAAPPTTQPGTPPSATPPGASPGVAPPTTEPGTPPHPTPPGTPPGTTPPPGTPPENLAPPISAPGVSAPPPGSAAPAPESTTPPSSTPGEPSKACNPPVLNSGEFATSEQSPATTLDPGASDPHTVVPGQTVFVESGTPGSLEPCAVPNVWTPPS
ncbi:membrane-bound lytic murein transglycosylase B [Saccharopolyspora spinosa]|uniref:Membrane-bound lytic murein transglycosylase B n=1 Tax=Saccharopolyspora spinosa TaxID=60894 RepID=A0A2N3XUA4_SACSN|nr:membrane-bound lytic murein transglycosylase B [Saccharopolyspora spinosa]